jgi:hypothetical protein
MVLRFCLISKRTKARVPETNAWFSKPVVVMGRVDPDLGGAVAGRERVLHRDEPETQQCQAKCMRLERMKSDAKKLGKKKSDKKK